MSIPVLETPHLLLRAWAPEDAAALFEILQQDGILRYFPNPNPPPRPKADDYIAHHLDHWNKFGYGHWAVVESADGRLVGWAGLEYLPELQETEVAYLFSRGVWGRGFATEAARAAISYGFEEAKLPAIIGLVHPQNAGSVRVLEKCSLSLAGRITLWGLEMLLYRINGPDYPILREAEAAEPGMIDGSSRRPYN